MAGSEVGPAGREAGEQGSRACWGGQSPCPVRASPSTLPRLTMAGAVPPACHILECPEGLAQDVISTIGQAFELRFKQYLRNPPKLVTPHDR